MLKISGLLSQTKIKAIKNCTFRVSRNLKGQGGNNYAYVATSTKAQTSLYLLGANIMWRGLSQSELDFWSGIAEKYIFYSRYTAFISSFLRSVQLFGYTHTMLTTLRYHYSPTRLDRRRSEQRSHERFMRNGCYFEKNSSSWDSLIAHNTELQSYELIPVIEQRENINDALDCKLIERKRGFGSATFGSESFGTTKRDYTHFVGFSTWKFGSGSWGVNN